MKPTIDEKELMELMAGNATPSLVKEEYSPVLIPEPQKTEKPRTKKARGEELQKDYETLFFECNDTAARSGKSVNIRPEYHQRLIRIVQIIGEDKISLYTYLDNILAQHFEQYGAAITQCFEEKYKPIL